MGYPIERPPLTNREWFNAGKREGLLIGFAMMAATLAGCCALAVSSWWFQ